MVNSDCKAKNRKLEVNCSLYKAILQGIQGKMEVWARFLFCKGRCMAGNFMLTIQGSFGRSSTVDYYVTSSLVFSATGDFYVCSCSWKDISLNSSASGF